MCNCANVCGREIVCVSVPESHHAHQNRTSKGTAARKDSPDSIQSLAFQIHFLRDQVRDGHVKLEMCRYSECFLRFDEELGPTCFWEPKGIYGAHLACLSRFILVLLRPRLPLWWPRAFSFRSSYPLQSLCSLTERGIYASKDLSISTRGEWNEVEWQS